MKKEKSPILVVFCMFMLLLLIVVPPVFRKYLPKKEVVKNNPNSISVLKCGKTFSDNIHNGSITSKYINNKIVTNTIKYKVITTEGDNNVVNSGSSYEDEYNIISNMKNIKTTTNDDLTTFIIDEEVSKENKNEQGITPGFQPIDEQKIFYENLGYTCQIIEG